MPDLIKTNSAEEWKCALVMALIHIVTSRGSARTSACFLLFAHGFGKCVGAESQSDLARILGMSKQAVNKRLEQIQIDFALVNVPSRKRSRFNS